MNSSRIPDRDEFVSAVTELFAEAVDSDVAAPSGRRIWQSISDLGLEVDDPLFVEPGWDAPEEVEPDDVNYLFAEYWVRLMEMFATRADEFEIHCWPGDDPAIAAAQELGGEVVEERPMIVLTGAVGIDWVERMTQVCWEPRRALKWMNVILFENGSCTVYCSHHGGELHIYLPLDLNEADVRAIFPASVTLTRVEE